MGFEADPANGEDQDNDSIGVESKSDEGTLGSHPEVQVRPFRVAPTVAGDVNVLSLDIPTVACLSMADILFAFDSSFVTPDAAKILKDLPGLREQHKNPQGDLPPLSIFGHADPVGTDDYNKALSGRRARAVYGLLLHDVAIWEDLFNTPTGGDNWASHDVTKIMLNATGQPAGTPRKQLIAAYMKVVSPFQSKKTDFLGQGASAKGKADFQGCGEFNPLLLLSNSDNSSLPEAERNRRNQPNRRVVIFLFCPKRKVNANAWPCPAASEGVAGCKLRFFLDGEKRRTPAQNNQREFAKTRDTFACRFYDRIARFSPCEAPIPPAVFGLVRPLIDFGEPVPDDSEQPAQAGDPGFGSASAVTASAKAPAPPAPAPAPAPVKPSVSPNRNVVVVAKPHTKPARVPVLLKTDTAFNGTGTFTASPADTIQFFTTAKGGTPIKFTGKDNLFGGKALTKGVTLFARGAKPSAAAQDVTITLTLKGGAKKINNNPSQAKMTSVEVTLDICKVRTAAGADPAALTIAEKVEPGRAIHVQSKDNKKARALLIIRQVKPAAFTGKLVLSAKDAKIKLFTNEKPTAGETAAALPKDIDPATVPATGLKFFVEGATVSAALKDTAVTLGVKDIEPDGDHVNITVIEAKLDICGSREKAGTDPKPLSDDDKVKVGRPIHRQDAAKSRSRAKLIIHQVKPAAFKGKLVLTPLDAKVQVFANEKPKGEAALATPLEIDHGPAFPAAGSNRFAEGATVSTALRDTGFTLGVKDVEVECDRVTITVFQIVQVAVKLRGTPCKRDGSLATTMAPKTINSDHKNFDATAFTIVRNCGDLEMEATAKPAAVTVTWDSERAADDDKSLTGLPTHAANGSDKKRKVTADATGSFHVSAFVDTNGNNKRNGDEDGVRVNVTMVGIKVKPGATNNIIKVNPTFSNARSTAGALVVDSGTSQGNFTLAGIGASYTDAEFAKHAIGMHVTVTVTGGGVNLRRGNDKVTLGYNQTTTPDDTVKGTYADGRTEAEVLFVLPIPAANLGPGKVVISNPPPPAPPHPKLAFPVRDTRGAATKATGIFIISSTDNDKKNLPKGEERTCRFIDPPAIVLHMRHPVTNSPLASIAGSNDFEDFVCAFSADWDENFVVISQATWKVTYGSFTAAGGWTNAGAAVTPSGAAMNVISPPAQGEKTNMERCPPNFVDNLRLDAR